MKHELHNWLHKDIIVNPKGTKTFLGFHGFGGSPFDYKPLSDILIKHNVRVVLPKIDDARLAKVASNEISLKQFLQPYEQIILQELRRDPQLCLAGFSMGGAISSIFASKYPISKLLLLAPYYELTHFNNIATPLGHSIAPLITHIPKFQSGRIKYRKGRKEYECPTYSVNIEAFVGLQTLAKEAQTSIQRVPPSIPVLWCHGKSDPVASYRMAKEYIPKHAKHLTLLQTDHIVLYDHDKKLVMKAALDFLHIQSGKL
jgi:esterase/lipase